MKLSVNGVERSIESPPLTPLLHVLREELGITSPKAGCQQGGCGACTILVDGAARGAPACCRSRSSPEPRSRRSKAWARRRRSRRSRPRSTSTTPRSAASAPPAWCSPPTPTWRAAAPRNARRSRKALAGHVCRCTGYVKIIDAVAAAAGGEIEAQERWLPQPGEEAPVEVPGAPA